MQERRGGTREEIDQNQEKSHEFWLRQSWDVTNKFFWLYNFFLVICKQVGIGLQKNILVDFGVIEYKVTVV